MQEMNEMRDRLINEFTENYFTNLWYNDKKVPTFWEIRVYMGESFQRGTNK